MDGAGIAGKPEAAACGETADFRKEDLIATVYLFFSGKDVIIPFYRYDAELFRKLLSSKVGSWDRVQRRYVFPRKYAGRIVSQILSGYSCVSINGPPSALPPGNSIPKQAVAKKYAPQDDARCLAASQARFELFSAYWQEKLATELHAGKYSRKTIQAYLHYNKAFCRTLGKRPEDISAGDIKAYLAHMDKSLDLSASSINLALSSLKFFYAKVLRKDVSREQHRPRQDKRLPVVLSKAEIEHILDTEKNPKHRLLLMLAYSSGLRVSEVVALKKDDIDFERKTLLVRLGKGRKDRYTLLSDRAARFIKEYCSLYDINPWLFPGHITHRPLSIRSAQSIFKKALQNAGINKIASIHTLRHAFATHLLESGTDIKYIQALMGHISIRTTERYTHVARKHILRIQSPLDTVPGDL
jgi:site-specific recombinase XerD